MAARAARRDGGEAKRQRRETGERKSGWDAEGRQYPRNATRAGDKCKMQTALRQLLEGLQLVFNLHFADGDWDGVTASARDSLTLQWGRQSK